MLQSLCKRALRKVSAWFVVLMLAGPVRAELPAPVDNYLNDFTGSLTVAEQQQLQSAAAKLEQDTGVELTIVLVDRVATFQEGASIESFARRLFDHWGVGNTERQDGILLLLAREDRAVRIELGLGYGHDHDAAMQRVINDEMLPSFKKDRYGIGLLAGVEALVDFAHDWHTLRQSDSLLQRFWFQLKRTFRSGWTQLAVLFATGGIGWQLFRRWNRNRPRNCQQCGSHMVRLSEVLDDRYLDPGQRTEERVGSVDYDVWKCTQCAEHEVIEYLALLSQHRRCDSCKRRACEKQSRHVLGDRVVTTYRCRHCQHIQKTYTAVQDSSPSRGFGGGRSGGGGATGRW